MPLYDELFKVGTVPFNTDAVVLSVKHSPQDLKVPDSGPDRVQVIIAAEYSTKTKHLLRAL